MDKRIMSYFGHVIWYGEGVYMVAKGDGTDEHFSSIYDAMEWIEKKEEEKEKRRAK